MGEDIGAVGEEETSKEVWRRKEAGGGRHMMQVITAERGGRASVKAL